MPPIHPTNPTPVKFQLTVKDPDNQIDTDEVNIKYSCLVDIYVDAFIPFPRVKNPDPTAVHTFPPGSNPPFEQYSTYAGDDHIEPIKKGSARMWSYVIVDLCNHENPLISKNK